MKRRLKTLVEFVKLVLPVLTLRPTLKMWTVQVSYAGNELVVDLPLYQRRCYVRRLIADQPLTPPFHTEIRGRQKVNNLTGRISY